MKPNRRRHPAPTLATPAAPAPTGAPADLVAELVGAARFVLAFYEPGQKHLDTEAWKLAEADLRRVVDAVAAWHPAAPARIETCGVRGVSHGTFSCFRAKGHDGAHEAVVTPGDPYSSTVLWDDPVAALPPVEADTDLVDLVTDAMEQVAHAEVRFTLREKREHIAENLARGLTLLRQVQDRLIRRRPAPTGGQ